MRSMSVRTLIASLVLIGVLLPSRAAGQEGPEVEVRRLSNLWLCPMPVTGLSPGAVQDHIDALRSKLSNEKAEPTASGACGVAQARLATVPPVLDVVGLGEPEPAAGEPAAAVAHVEGAADGGRRGAGASTAVEDGAGLVVLDPGARIRTRSRPSRIPSPESCQDPS